VGPQSDQHPQQETLAVPGWGTAFPPEQPRRDMAEAPAPETGIPTAASVAAASAVGMEAAADFTHEDRRPFDRRRRKARAIDNLLLVPVAIAIVKLNGGASIAAGLLFLSIEMSYFFLFEALKGQTLGKRFANLRVVKPDGTAASTGKIAIRTLLRPIDYTLFGIICVLATGKKRQRLGDLAANTIVRDDNRLFKRPPESPLLVVFPLLWIGAAVAAMVLLKPVDPMLAKRNEHPYMAKIDKICEKTTRQADALTASGQMSLTSMRLLMRQQQRKIEKLPPPPREVKGDVKTVLQQHRRINKVLTDFSRDLASSTSPEVITQRYGASIPAVTATADQKFEELGLPYCAE
jgi:hypothetical protein